MTLRPRRLIMWSCVVWVVTLTLLVFSGSIWASYERHEHMMSATERTLVSPEPTLPHPTPLAAPVKHGTRLEQLADSAARLCGVPAKLFRALISRESSWNPHAVSRSGALGLGQLMPAAALEMGVENRLDPWQNLIGSACYLRLQFDRFGTWRKALHAYHAGANRSRTSSATLAYAADIIQGSAQ